MISLANLQPAPFSKKSKKRLGRGEASGHGKTSCRGHKGAKARSGNTLRPGFEGGQMPLQRRLPKGGFKNPFKIEFQVINVEDLNNFEDGTLVDKNLLIKTGSIKKKTDKVKLLGNGDLHKKIIISLDRVSNTAKEKVVAAGGQIEG